MSTTDKRDEPVARTDEDRRAIARRHVERCRRAEIDDDQVDRTVGLGLHDEASLELEGGTDQRGEHHGLAQQARHRQRIVVTAQNGVEGVAEADNAAAGIELVEGEWHHGIIAGLRAIQAHGAEQVFGHGRGFRRHLEASLSLRLRLPVATRHPSIGLSLPASAESAPLYHKEEIPAFAGMTSLRQEQQRPLDRRLVRCDPEGPAQNSFLGMEAIFGLVKHNRLGTIDHFVGHLIATVGGQAVHEQGVFFRQGHQTGVYLIGFQDPATLGSVEVRPLRQLPQR